MDIEFYKRILEEAPVGYAYHKIICDKDGIPCDFQYLEVNSAFEKVLKLKAKDIIGKRATELITDLREHRFNWVDFFGEIALNGGSKEIEQFWEPGQCRYKIKAYSPRKDEFVAIFSQASDQELKQEKLKKYNNYRETAILENHIDNKVQMGAATLERKQRVLIVDDVPINIKLLEVVLKEDYKISVATSGKEALSIAHSDSPPDIILLDIMMPEMNGYEVCIKLIEDRETKDIPIIFLTAMQEEENQEYGLKLGAIDYIQKPFSIPILKTKIKNHLELKQYKDMLKENCWMDGLTQIANRRKFNEMLSREMKRAKSSGSYLSVLMIDIDYFKKYNDRYGHLEGDECLRKVAEALRNVLNRPRDLVTRWGGEEFACLLPDTDKLGAALIGEKMRKAIMDLAILHETSLSGKIVTVSVGVATASPDDDSYEKLLKQSDDNLYKAKEKGRNSMCF